MCVASCWKVYTKSEKIIWLEWSNFHLLPARHCYYRAGRFAATPVARRCASAARGTKETASGWIECSYRAYSAILGQLLGGLELCGPCPSSGTSSAHRQPGPCCHKRLAPTRLSGTCYALHNTPMGTVQLLLPVRQLFTNNTVARQW